MAASVRMASFAIRCNDEYLFTCSISTIMMNSVAVSNFMCSGVQCVQAVLSQWQN